MRFTRFERRRIRAGYILIFAGFLVLLAAAGASDAGGPMPWAAIVAGMVLMSGGGAMIC